MICHSDADALQPSASADLDLFDHNDTWEPALDLALEKAMGANSNGVRPAASPQLRGIQAEHDITGAASSKPEGRNGEKQEWEDKPEQSRRRFSSPAIGAIMAFTISLVAIIIQLVFGPFGVTGTALTQRTTVPDAAQVVNQKTFNALSVVPPVYVANATSGPFIFPGATADSLKAKPFHIYDDEFYDIIGTDPSLTLIASSPDDPLFHEAVVWYPPTDEVFFVQNAGPASAGTGLNKSAIIEKISLKDANQVRTSGNASARVTVATVPSNPQVVNPNGGTNYKGNIIFVGEGMGDNITSTMYLMNPREPYNTTVLVNNYFGRQFNSLNDVAVHPSNGDIYFTDTLYGYLQDFRPTPGLPNQVYRLNPVTGALTVVADGFVHSNGITFSPDGTLAYIADTGIAYGNYGTNLSDPATLYRFNVQPDGTWESRKTFAFVSPGNPDGVHCDAQGNVYAGCGDGVQVWNPSGKLVGKIYTGNTTANFQFAGKGRMVICSETELWYATVEAAGQQLAF